MNMRHLKYNSDILNLNIFPSKGINVPSVPQSGKKKEGEVEEEHEAADVHEHEAVDEHYHEAEAENEGEDAEDEATEMQFRYHNWKRYTQL